MSRPLAALIFAVLCFLTVLAVALSARAAPQQQIPINSQGYILVLMNTDTAYQLPTTPSWPMGYPILVYDNLGGAGGATITISGKCAAGTSTITTNYGNAAFRWTGACWQ